MLMMNKSLFALVALVTVSLTSADGLSPKRIKKSYDTLNKHLDKEAAGKKPQDFMQEVIYLINTRKIFDSIQKKSYMETLRLLHQLQKKWSIAIECRADELRRLLEKLDDAWDEDESRQVEINYPITKVDEMIAFHGFRAVRDCPLDTDWPQLKYAFKQLAYDYINDYLLAQLEENEDIETNMNKCHELLHSLHLKDRAVGQALQQLLQLRSTLGEGDNCTVDNDQIILRNQLATKGLARKNSAGELPRRRIDLIVYHYTEKYKETCRVTRERFDQALKQLNVNTYRSVLGLVNYYYLADKERTGELIKYLQHKEVDGDFTTPMLEEYAKSLGENEQLGEVRTIEISDLRNYVKYLTQLVPGTWATPDEERDERRKLPKDYELKTEGAVNDYFNRFLIVPCNVYLKKMGRFVGSTFAQNHRDYDEQLEEDLSFQVARAACQACSFVDTNHRDIYYGMM